MIRIVLAAALCALAVGPRALAATSDCPSSNPPNALQILGGSGQTAKLGTEFQTSLRVALANSNGCPVTGELAGIGIAFVAPSSGAGGTFASTGSNVAVVGTDSNGVAVAPALTANDTAGTYAVRADSSYGSVTLYLENTSRAVPASIAATGQADQSTAVNSRYGQPLQVQVLDAGGNPVQGANVSFSLGTGSSGASAGFLGGGGQTTVTTNASGVATSPPFVANGEPGPFTATASTGRLAAIATFNLDNHAAGTTIAATASAEQSAVVDGRYAQPLQARVLDANGQPIEGASVSFALGAATGGAGASFVGGGSQATELTDADGLAVSPPLQANGVAGRFTATAAVAGNNRPLTYALENLAGAAATIAAGAASGEATPAGTRFPVRLAVTVADANKNPVSGALVTFTAPARGPSGRFATGARVVTVKTDAGGVAVAPPFRANAKVGGYAVTAVVGNGRETAFALVNKRP